MTIQSPPWVRQACLLWGRQKRRIWAGGDWYRTSLGAKLQHVDGYAQSFLGRVQDEKVGAGSPAYLRQHWPEVYIGEALEVQRALGGMPEVAFVCLHLHYVFDPEFGLVARRKAYLVGLGTTTYWAAVASGEAWLYARMAPEKAAEAAAATVRPLKPLNRKLESVTKRAKRGSFRANSSMLAGVSLDALNRPRLSLKT